MKNLFMVDALGYSIGLTKMMTDMQLQFFSFVIVKFSYFKVNKDSHIFII